MNYCFCTFRQTRFWHEIREHLSALPGISVPSAVDDPIIGSWIDFTHRGHLFTITSQSGKFIFFVEDPDCPAPVLAEITAHFETLLSQRTDSRRGMDATVRRV